MKPRLTYLFSIWTGLIVLFQTASAQSTHWQKIASGTFLAVAFNPLSHGRTIFAAPYDTAGFLRSDDGGMTWKNYSAGLENSFSTSEFHQILCLPSDTNILIAVSPTKLYRSTNGGMAWTPSDTLGGIDGEDLAYHAKSDVVYYGKNFAGPTYKSIDHGASWILTGGADTSIGLCTIAVSPDDPPVLVSGSGNGILARSTNEGDVWTKTFPPDTGMTLPPEVPKVVFSDYAIGTDGSHHIAIATRWLSFVRSVVLTADGGLTWSVLPFPSRHSWALDIDQRASKLNLTRTRPLHFWNGLFRDRSDTVNNGMVQETTDGGVSWHSTNFPTKDNSNMADSFIRDVWMLKYDTTSTKLLAATGSGVYVLQTEASVRGVDEQSTVQIFQNGTNTTITSGIVMSSAEIFDMLGRPIERQQLNALSFHPTLGNAPPGVYIIKIVFASKPAVYLRFVRD